MAFADRRPVVAIVGAGFSGSMVASHLLCYAKQPLNVVLIDRHGSFGLGIAYGTQEEHHLLNVSAGAMSALPDDPSHLLRWLDHNRETLGSHLPDPLESSCFLPRRIYGLYLQSILQEAEAQAATEVTLRRHTADLLDVEPLPSASSNGKAGEATARLHFREGPPLDAHHVVLAWGNSLLPLPEVSSGPERHGWSPEATADLHPDASVLLLGTGLTMVDKVVSLWRQGHRGPIVALSRRGHRPLPHQMAPPLGPWLDPAAAPSTTLALWRQIRRRAEQAVREGADWRPVIDGLRPVTQQLWARLDGRERRRFLRHAAVIWDVHRHRIAPDLHQLLAHLQQTGQLRFLAGRLLKRVPEGAEVRVEIRRRGSSSTETSVFARLIRCTGLPISEPQPAAPLLAHLLHRGLVVSDPLRLGLRCDGGGALVGADGGSIPWLSTLGPPRRGEFWESIAVPELRQQAQQLAMRLLSSLTSRSLPLVSDLPASSRPLELPATNHPGQPLLWRQLFDPETSSFTYLLADPTTGEAALVDSVLEHLDRDLQLMREMNLTLRFCLETHLHADHITAAGQLRRRTGCRLIVPAAPGISNADQLLHGGERIQLGSLRIEVISTPGHTPEHVAYRIGNSHLLTGDCLLIRGCGRSDFQNGNASDLFDSLQRLLALPPTLAVYPAHDAKGRTQSTIAEERRWNPRVAGRTRAQFIDLMNNLRLDPPRKMAVAVPANQHLGDLLPPEEPSSEHALHEEARKNAQAVEKANKDIFNDFIGMFI